MPLPPPRAALERSVRLLRLAGGVAVVLALLAIAGITRNMEGAKSATLIAAAIVLGAGALIGLAVAAWPYLRREKERHDPRS